MPQIRFHIDGQPPSEWLEETILNRQQGQPTAVVAMGELRGKFPSAAIRIERRGDIHTPNPVPLFRYNITVREGRIQVKDNDGVHSRKLKDSLLQSRPFHAGERDKVLAEIKAQFPDAVLTEVAL